MIFASIDTDYTVCTLARICFCFPDSHSKLLNNPKAFLSFSNAIRTALFFRIVRLFRGMFTNWIILVCSVTFIPIEVTYSCYSWIYADPTFHVLYSVRRRKSDLLVEMAHACTQNVIVMTNQPGWKYPRLMMIIVWAQLLFYSNRLNTGWWLWAWGFIVSVSTEILWKKFTKNLLRTSTNTKNIFHKFLVSVLYCKYTRQLTRMMNHTKLTCWLMKHSEY